MKCIPKGKGVLRAIDKKADGDRIFYLLAKGKWRKWVDFEDLNEHLQLVIDFEEKLEKKGKDTSQSPAAKASPSGEVSHEAKIEKMRRGAKEKSEEAAEVANIVFLNVVEKELFFRVFYGGGRQEVMNSQQLRARHPQELITFYENNVEIGDGGPAQTRNE